MTRNRPETDPNPIITRKYDPKTDPTILRPAQNLSGRFGSGRFLGGPGQVLTPKYMYTYFGRLIQLLSSSNKVQVEIGYMLDEFSIDIAFYFSFILRTH